MFSVKHLDAYFDITDRKLVYRSGDVINGELKLYLKESLRVKKVSVSFHGATLTRLSNKQPKADDNIWFEDVTTLENILLPTSGILEDTFKFSRGGHNYNFSFKIPTGILPSSYEGKYGAIRYWLSFDIERPALRKNISLPLIITVLDDIDVNLPEYCQCVAKDMVKTVSYADGCGHQGTVTLFAEIDRGAYCPGEKIFIKYIAENKSDINLGNISIQLMQEVKFRAIDEEKLLCKCLKKIEGGEIKKGVKVTSLDEKHFILVPAIPPSTRFESTCSHMIKVQYFIKVMIDVPNTSGGDAIMILPVTIGTIPLGTRLEDQGPSKIHDAVGSSAFTYFKYEDGFEDGSNVWSRNLNFHFPKCPYLPYCPYVFDYMRPKIKDNTTSVKPFVTSAHSANGDVIPVENKLANESEQTLSGSKFNVLTRFQPATSLDRPQTSTLLYCKEVSQEMDIFPKNTAGEKPENIKHLIGNSMKAGKGQDSLVTKL